MNTVRQRRPRHAKRSEAARDRNRSNEVSREPAPPSRVRNAIAYAGVAILGFAASFRKLDDFDTWWHLAAGRWIAVHRAIPSTDTLSHTVRDHAWINLQWGFDVLLYVLHSAGGPVGLSLAAAAVFVATALLLMRLLSARLGAELAALLMVAVIVAAQERLTIRPELLSFLLLAAVLFVLDRGKRSDERWFIALVPLMIFWVNVHSLFVIGAFAIGAALIGDVTKPPRGLVIFGGAALASVVVNPHGLTGVLFPLKLISRIDGSEGVFQTVGEFGSPFAVGATGVSVVLFKVMLVVGLALAVYAMVNRRRQFDWGGLIWCLGLAALGASARRNIALFAIGTAPFVGSWLEVALKASPQWWNLARRRAPVILGVAMAAVVLISGALVTGAFYKTEAMPREFGGGIIDGTFPMRAAAFAREAKLPGKLYNDMPAGGYLAWDDPIGDGVFIDGRLEVYDSAFVTEFVNARSSPERWQADADRYGIQTAIIFHQFVPEAMLTERLANDDRWSLVYVDETAAVFVRRSGNDAALARASAIRPEWDARTDAWLSRPSRRWPYPAGRIEGTRAYARLLGSLGHIDAAVAAYRRLVELNISSAEEVEHRVLLARYFAGSDRTSEALEQVARILEIDPSNAEARAMIGR
jgi:hypothetical protein